MNPLAFLVVAVALGAVVLVSLDPVTAGLVIVLGIASLVFFRIPLRRSLIGLGLTVIAAFLFGLTTALYGRPSGVDIWEWGLVHVTSGSISLAGIVALRVVAIGIPSVVFFASTTPSRLADALGQVWHLPVRFVLGALAGMRLVATVRQDWTDLAMARRARGLYDPSRAGGFFLAFPSVALALFVRAVRRANLLATVMESRGLGNSLPRTWAHESLWRRRDWILVGIGLALAAAVVVTSVAVGSWRVVYG